MFSSHGGPRSCSCLILPLSFSCLYRGLYIMLRSINSIEFVIVTFPHIKVRKSAKIRKVAKFNITVK